MTSEEIARLNALKREAAACGLVLRYARSEEPPLILSTKMRGGACTVLCVSKYLSAIQNAINKHKEVSNGNSLHDQAG